MYAQDHKLHYYSYHFGGALKKQNVKKMTIKQSEENFFDQRCEKTVTSTEMASRF